MDTTPYNSAWARFWHKPVRAERLALMRILLGLALLTQQLLEFIPHLMEYYGPGGVAPAGLQDDRQGRWWYWSSLIFNTDDPATIYAVFSLWIFVTFAFTIGFFTRLMNVALWFLTMCFLNRNYLLLNGGDAVLQVGIFLLMLAPSGRALSVDAWWRRRRGIDQGPVYTAAWPVRLIQIQLCVIYCTTGLVKLKGTGVFEGMWWDGTAIHYTLNYMTMNRYSYLSLPVPLWITAPMTWIVVWWETLFPLLVLSRWTRRWALWFGLLFHLGIFVTLAIGWFSLFTMTFYAVWVPDEFWARRDRRAASES